MESTMSEDWIGRWERGRTGWHEPAGNSGLRKYWPALPGGTRVLVPLCGKARDLLWLADHGCSVTGVEISSVAVEAFFQESGLAFERVSEGPMAALRAVDRDIIVYCGDYFAFDSEPFDAVYDRGALVALPKDLRPAYVRHTDHLLRTAASILLITLEYDQTVVSGPPFSIMPSEVHQYWPSLRRCSELEDIDNAPPKFRAAGLHSMLEVVWLSD
jgi:thiopurine S-methyltransferase